MGIGRKRRAVALLLVATSASGSAGAASVGERLARAGNQNGATACIACHGEAGGGQAAIGSPYLAGLDRHYLIGQIEAFKTGKRVNPVMRPIADALSPEETEAVAAYFSGLPLPEQGLGAPGMAAGAVEARRLMTEGKWQQAGMPACVSCHGPGGQGVGTAFPNIAGQPAAYTKAQLEAWRQGQRSSDPNKLMQSVAEKLTPQEIDSLAAYLSSLSPAAPGTAQPQGRADGDMGGMGGGS